MFKEVALLFHSPIGKSTQAQRYTAAANYRYITRQSATDYAEHHGMPNGYRSAQDWLRRHERSIRANGRVIDKLIVVFPVGMAQPHAVDALRSFMGRVSDQRAPYVFTLQNFEVGEVNPHAHVIFVDRDTDTGRRVFGTSERGSSDRLRAMWMEDANQVLEREGYDIRLGMHRDAPTRELEEPAAEMQESDEEPAMSDEEEPTVSEKIGRAAKLAEEMRGVSEALEKSQRLRDQLSNAEAAKIQREAEREQRDAAERLADRAKNEAERELSGRTRPNGKLKGFEIFGFRTPGRKAAEASQKTYNQRIVDASDAEQYHRDAKHRVWEAEQDIQRYTAAIQHFEEFERVYGTDAEMQEAKSGFKQEYDELLASLSPQQVYEMLEFGEITEDQAIALLRDMGDEVYLARIEQTREL